MNKNELMNKLKQIGINTDQAISRFMGNEDLFISFIRRLPKSIDFEDIRQSLEVQDEERFYMQIHNLKSTAGNLGVESLFECAQAILVEFRTSKFKQMKKLTELVKEAELQGEFVSKVILSYELQNGEIKCNGTH